MAAEQRRGVRYGFFASGAYWQCFGLVFAKCLLALGGMVGALPTAQAAETWQFVDGEGVLHMGNAAERTVDPDDKAPPETVPPSAGTELGARAVRVIHRTWALRYPTWQPSSTLPPALPSLAGNLALARLPRGFSDVKPYLDAAAQSHAVDPALVYSVAAAESAFNAEAVSHKGALGLMQIMPGTAARYGVTGYSLDTGRHNVLEPKVNAQVGSRYLADLLRMFGGDATLAVAAYNAGEGAVSKYGNRVPPYPETQKYVERVMGYYRSFKQ